jgi:hypothetical protein
MESTQPSSSGHQNVQAPRSSAWGWAYDASLAQPDRHRTFSVGQELNNRYWDPPPPAGLQKQRVIDGLTRREAQTFGSSSSEQSESTEE